ncbi:DNA polymerase III subunit epsilon [Salipiger pallidus]|uniref:DNA polymerase III subunit epsilon n=1 Tax=Salipiger pallidus TaxID=1775170 RepID=A0A8J3EHH4_9RHOB|nr:DNA polymerase III subunit epsilon [Salipiger pallidus]GGG78874.1 DNA polymerase III subunit epsilon [Salipiger pallidus]
MREIVLDTETTGFEPEQGDRIVEIGAVELYNHMPTGRTYHQYINPERGMPEGAFGVHGLGPDLLSPPRPAEPGEVTLRDKPLFAQIVDDFIEFVGNDAKLVIHNATFDVKFLNAELNWAGKPLLPKDCAIDTLEIARRRFPGSPASLDALCRRFGIDNSSRTLHGALLDSEILAEVYLELIGGKQPDLVLSPVRQSSGGAEVDEDWRPTRRPEPLPPRLTDEEKAAHAAFVDKMGDGALWKRA